MPATQPRCLLRQREVLKRIGLGATSLKTMVKDGKFPRPVPLGARAIAWDSALVDEWVEAKLKGGPKSRKASPRARL